MVKEEEKAAMEDEEGKKKEMEDGEIDPKKGAGEEKEAPPFFREEEGDHSPGEKGYTPPADCVYCHNNLGKGDAFEEKTEERSAGYS